MKSSSVDFPIIQNQEQSQYQAQSKYQDKYQDKDQAKDQDELEQKLYSIFNEDDDKTIYCKNTYPKILSNSKKPISADNLSYQSNNFPDCSDNIIPSYYLTNLDPGKIFNIDFFDTIIDSIKNMRKLTKYQLEYIKNNISKDDMFELICLFDKISNDYYEMFLSDT
jgi:hypothetical protein